MVGMAFGLLVVAGAVAALLLFSELADQDYPCEPEEQEQ